MFIEIMLIRIYAYYLHRITLNAQGYKGTLLTCDFVNDFLEKDMGISTLMLNSIDNFYILLPMPLTGFIKSCTLVDTNRAVSFVVELILS